MTTLLSSTCCGAMILETSAKEGEILTEASVVRTFNGVGAKDGTPLSCPVCGQALYPDIVAKTLVEVSGPWSPWCSCGAGEFQPPEKHVAPCPGAVGA